MRKARSASLGRPASSTDLCHSQERIQRFAGLCVDWRRLCVRFQPRVSRGKRRRAVTMAPYREGSPKRLVPADGGQYMVSSLEVSADFDRNDTWRTVKLGEGELKMNCRLYYANGVPRIRFSVEDGESGKLPKRLMVQPVVLRRTSPLPSRNGYWNLGAPALEVGDEWAEGAGHMAGLRLGDGNFVCDVFMSYIRWKPALAALDKAVAEATGTLADAVVALRATSLLNRPDVAIYSWPLDSKPGRPIWLSSALLRLRSEHFATALGSGMCHDKLPDSQSDDHAEYRIVIRDSTQDAVVAFFDYLCTRQIDHLPDCTVPEGFQRLNALYELSECARNRLSLILAGSTCALISLSPFSANFGASYQQRHAVRHSSSCRTSSAFTSATLAP